MVVAQEHLDDINEAKSTTSLTMMTAPPMRRQR
jgi:hypothetical protein